MLAEPKSISFSFDKSLWSCFLGRDSGTGINLVVGNIDHPVCQVRRSKLALQLPTHLTAYQRRSALELAWGYVVFIVGMDQIHWVQVPSTRAPTRRRETISRLSVQENQPGNVEAHKTPSNCENGRTKKPCILVIVYG